MKGLTQRETDLVVFAISFLQSNLDDALEDIGETIEENELILLEEKILGD